MKRLSKPLHRFLIFNFCFHFILGLIVIVLYNFFRETLDYTLVIGVILSVVNYLYWGYHLQQLRGNELYLFSALMIYPFMYFLMIILRVLAY